MEKRQEQPSLLSKQGALSDDIYEFYDQEIIGQDHVKKLMTKVLSDIHQEFNYRSEKPLSVLFFKGPTGVGKTEIVKQTAELLFGDKMAFTHIPCEQMRMEHEGSATLFGSPAGYVGYGQKPLLHPDLVFKPWHAALSAKRIHKIAGAKYQMSIILFDEIEKMHPKTRQSLLSMVDEGMVMLKDGTSIDLRNALMIFTSNVGESATASMSAPIGFDPKPTQTHQRKLQAKQQIFEQTFSPEFRGRLDHVIEFDPLSVDFVDKVLDKYKKELIADVSYATDQKIFVQYDEALINHIKSHVDVSKGYRNIYKYWTNNVRNSLGVVLKINKLTNRLGKHILKVLVQDNDIVFSLEEDIHQGLVGAQTDRTIARLGLPHHTSDSTGYGDGGLSYKKELIASLVQSLANK